MEELVSIQDYLDIVKRRKWSLVLPALIIFSVSVVAAYIWPRTYRSTATILIEEQEIPRDFVASTVTGFADQRLQIINQRVMITAKLLEIINRFNLYPEMRKSRTTEEIIDRMRKDTTFNTISAEVRSGRPATIAFTLSYDGQNPQIVQQVTGVLTSLYLEENIKVREQQTEGTYKFLEDEAQKMKDQLSKIDAQLADFKKKNMDALPDLLQVNMQSLERTERDLDQLYNTLSGLRERESNYQSQLSNIPADTENQDKALLKDLQTKLIQLESRYSDQYPDVIKAKTEIARIEERIAKASAGGSVKPSNPAYITLASQLASVRSEIGSVMRQMEDLRQKRNEYQRRMDMTPKVDEVYKGLLSERNNTQTKYDDLVKKSIEAKVSKGLEKQQMGERFVLIDPPQLPEKPVKPNIPAILLIGLALGIGAGAGLTSILEYSDTSVRSIRSLSKGTSLPVLGSVPVIVTRGDKKRQRTKQMYFAFGMLAVLAVGMVFFHLYVMDLGVLWAKISRRLPV